MVLYHIFCFEFLLLLLFHNRVTELYIKIRFEFWYVQNYVSGVFITGKLNFCCSCHVSNSVIPNT
jgi:hypothetical protein